MYDVRLFSQIFENPKVFLALGFCYIVVHNSNNTNVLPGSKCFHTFFVLEADPKADILPFYLN